MSPTIGTLRGFLAFLSFCIPGTFFRFVLRPFLLFAVLILLLANAQARRDAKKKAAEQELEKQKLLDEVRAAFVEHRNFHVDLVLSFVSSCFSFKFSAWEDTVIAYKVAQITADRDALSPYW